MPNTFNIETHRYPFFHRAFLNRKTVIVREGRGVVSSVGLTIQGGKPVFDVTLQDSRQPIKGPWFLNDAQYQKFVARVGRSTASFKESSQT